MSSRPKDRLVTVAEFLAFGFPDGFKAELIDGEIVAMAGGSRRHARIQANFIVALGTRLRGSGCQPFGSDMAIRTGAHSLRYPDVSVLCGGGPDHDDDRMATDPIVIVEILSPTTGDYDQRVKLPEYRALPSVRTIMLIDPETETIRVVQREGPHDWRDTLAPADIPLPSLGVTLPRAEIFARD